MNTCEKNFPVYIQKHKSHIISGTLNRLQTTYPNVVKNIIVITRQTIDIDKPIYVTTDKARASSSGNI